MKKTLIFDDSVSGHHLEYLHHIYVRATELPEQEFIFVVPHEFKKVSSSLAWERAENIRFIFIDTEQAKTPRSRAKLLGQLVKETEANNVLLISLMSFLPWLPLYVPANVRVSGIVYLIYLYRWETASWKTRILDVLKYWLFSKCRVFHRVFLLNDKGAPVYLNKKFKTDKFEFLPDPVAIQDGTTGRNLRKELGLSDGIEVFSHFGGLSGRKGTLEILRAILAEKHNARAFIFAGKVGKEIRKEFYSLFNQAKAKGAHVFIFDEFCSYEFLFDLCRISKAVLIPYKAVDQSSGVIAYAARTGTPVIAPYRGLIGKLVKRYGLGTACGQGMPEEISRAINERKWRDIRMHGEEYLQQNSLSNFKDGILK